jgi:hypothetical protein
MSLSVMGQLESRELLMRVMVLELLMVDVVVPLLFGECLLVSEVELCEVEHDAQGHHPGKFY